MARWAFVVAALDGTELGDLVHATGRKLTWSLAAPHMVKWSSTGTDLGALLAEEMLTDLIVYRDGVKVFRGRIGGSGDDLDENSHKVDWSAVSYRGVLAGREIWPTVPLPNGPTFTATDQEAIAWSLIAATQALPGGDMGITRGSSATGVLRDRTYEIGKPIAEALDQLSQVQSGFDYDIDPDLIFQLWYPQRGATVDWAAVFRDTVSKVKRGVDTTMYASDLIGTGGEGTTTVVRSTVGARDAGRWERSVSWSDVTVQGTLVDHTEAALADAEVIQPTYQLTLRPGAWAPGDAWLGDTSRIVVRHGRLDVDTTGRIVQVDITVGDDGGDETVVVTMDRPRVSLADRLLGNAARIASLERR